MENEKEKSATNKNESNEEMAEAIWAENLWYKWGVYFSLWLFARSFQFIKSNHVRMLAWLFAVA